MASDLSGVTLISTERSVAAFAGTSTARLPMVTAAARGERLAHRIAERAPIGFVDERGDVREELADDLIEALAEQRLRPRD